MENRGPAKIQKPRTVQIYAEPAARKTPDYMGMTMRNAVDSSVIE